MIFIVCLLKNQNHLICRNIKIVVLFRKTLTFVYVNRDFYIHINHELLFTSRLQSIKKHRLIKI